jgi:WD40 repeat protein
VHTGVTEVVAGFGPRAYLRGLLPFERGETLLGRDGDVQRVLALVTSTEFRFGYLSGEAGSGKTSLLRAGIVPQAESQGRGVIYIPRTGNTPRTSLLQALEKQFPGAAGAGEGRSLRASLTATVRSQNIPHLLIVFDQFEEFLIANPTRSTRAPFLADVGECYAAANLPVAFLFSLRREFVEDLQDFAPGVPQPLDIRFRSSLRNWDRATALGVLNAAAAHDQVGFAETLKESLIADLLRDGQVRPVEVQLVATRLQDEGIHDVPRYRTAGGARGILAAYVKEAIEPLGPGTPELTRQITRHLLRALCAANRDVRRPKGLQLVELRDQIRAAMQVSGQGGLLASGAALDAALREALQRCLQRYLVIPESEESYNLAHDYIVPSIRDATAGLRTVEDQANQLLGQYLDYQTTDPRVVIPWRHWRFIDRHATPEVKGRDAARALFRRTRRRLAALAALAVLLPAQTSLDLQTEDVDPDRWILARDRQLAVGLTSKVKADVWRTDTPWSSRVELAIPFTDVIISPRSNFLAGRTGEGNVYVWRSRDRLTKEARPAVTGLVEGRAPRNASRPAWAGFSDDEKWIFVASADGKVYVWNPAEPLAQPPRPFLSLTAEKDQYGRQLPLPLVAFSPRGQWLVAADAAGVYLYQPADGPPVQTSPLLSAGAIPVQTSPLLSARTIAGPDDVIFSPEHVIFSRDGQWLAVAILRTGRDFSRPIIDYTVYAGLIQTHALNQLHPVRRKQGPDFLPYPTTTIVMGFSPDGKRLVFRLLQETFYTWEVTDPPRGEALAVTNVPSRAFASDPMMFGWSGSRAVRFSRDGKWAGGVDRDGGVYVWSLDRPPTASILPAEGRRLPPDVRFSPEGNFVVGRGDNGSVYSWTLGGQPDLKKSVAHYEAAKIDFVFTMDGRHLFAMGENILDWGELGQTLQPVLQAPHRLQDIALTPQGDALLVFGTRHITTIRRKTSFWGIPLWTRPWSLLAEREEWE